MEPSNQCNGTCEACDCIKVIILKNSILILLP
jgi:hypothetical protein